MPRYYLPKTLFSEMIIQNIEKDGKNLVYFVDLGNLDRVAPFILRPLEGIGERLAKIPKQVLLCKLHNVPSAAGDKWTQRACDSIDSLLEEIQEKWKRSIWG